MFPGFLGILLQVLEQGEVLSGSLLAFVKSRDGGKEILHGANGGVVPVFLDGIPIDIACLLRLLLLTEHPADVVDGLRDAGAAGILFLKVLHQVEVAIGFLHEFEGFSHFENTLLIKPRVRLRDAFERGNSLFHLALIHQGVAEKHTGFADFLMPGIRTQKGIELFDAGFVIFELLRAIGFAEHRVARVLAVLVFPEVVIHRGPRLLILLVERIPHPPPIR